MGMRPAQRQHRRRQDRRSRERRRRGGYGHDGLWIAARGRLRVTTGGPIGTIA